MATPFSDYMRELDADSTPSELALRNAFRAHHRRAAAMRDGHEDVPEERAMDDPVTDAELEEVRHRVERSLARQAREYGDDPAQ